MQVSIFHLFGAFICILGTTAGQCVFNLPVYTSPSPACFQYDLRPLARDTTIYTRQDSYPDSYLVSAPCSVVPLPQANCKNLSCPVLMPSPLYQLYPQNGGCIACGAANTITATLLDSSNPSAGVKVGYSGGNTCPGVSSPRTMAYWLKCNQSAPVDSVPSSEILTNTEDGYVVVWETRFACPTQVAPDSCPVVPQPTPTPAQLRWQQLEIGIRA